MRSLRKVKYTIQIWLHSYFFVYHTLKVYDIHITVRWSGFPNMQNIRHIHVNLDGFSLKLKCTFYNVLLSLSENEQICSSLEHVIDPIIGSDEVIVNKTFVQHILLANLFLVDKDKCSCCWCPGWHLLNPTNEKRPLSLQLSIMN